MSASGKNSNSGGTKRFYARQKEFEKCRDAYENALMHGYAAPEKLLQRINCMKKIREEKIYGEDTDADAENFDEINNEQKGEDEDA